METPVTSTHRRPPKFIRIAKARPRLIIAIAIGLALAAALMLLTDWRAAYAALIGWDVCAGLYLVLALQLMAKSDVHHMRRRARQQDEGQFAVLILTAVAAFASLAAIFVLLGTSHGRTAADIFLAAMTIVISWAFTHTIFALHYAHEYYDENGGKGGGMKFPGEDPEPDYWDFMYFSFGVGMCAQVSDVAVSCRPIRRTVLGHSVISFIFNVALL